MQKILDFCSHLVRESEVQATSSEYQTEHKKFIKEFFAFDMRDLAGLLNVSIRFEILLKTLNSRQPNYWTANHLEKNV